MSDDEYGDALRYAMSETTSPGTYPPFSNRRTVREDYVLSPGDYNPLITQTAMEALNRQRDSGVHAATFTNTSAATASASNTGPVSLDSINTILNTVIGNSLIGFPVEVTRPADINRPAISRIGPKPLEDHQLDQVLRLLSESLTVSNQLQLSGTSLEILTEIQITLSTGEVIKVESTPDSIELEDLT